MSQRRLTVTSCDVKFEGTSKSGKDYTLYEVAVVDEAGDPIMEEFKSFDMLPIGELVDYEVEREDHPTYGVSYMLKLPRGMKAAARPNTRADIEDLRQRVARLESQVGSLNGTSEPVSPALAPMSGTADEDIPF